MISLSPFFSATCTTLGLKKQNKNEKNLNTLLHVSVQMISVNMSARSAALQLDQSAVTRPKTNEWKYFLLNI